MCCDSKIPVDLYYTNDHMWVLVEENIGTIGITDYGQIELAEVVYVELPEVDTDVGPDIPFGTIEARNKVAELLSPVAGKVIEKNEALESDPVLINIDPYGEGWLIKVMLLESSEVEYILKPEDYRIYISEEEMSIE